MTARNHSRPWASILAHRSGGKRIERCTRRWFSGIGGRPPLFLGCSIGALYVMQILVAALTFV